MSLYEFQPSYQFDETNTSLGGSGSGVHLFKDVTLTFDMLDRFKQPLNTSKDINDNVFVKDMSISIYNTYNDLVYENFYSGIALRSFTFTEQNNIDVFGEYTKDFIINAKLKDSSAGVFSSNFSLFGNTPSIEYGFITDAEGVWLYEASQDDWINPTPTSYGSSPVYPSGRIAVIGTPVTGGLILDLRVENDAQYTQYSHIDIHVDTGENFPITIDNFKKRIPISTTSPDWGFRFSADDFSTDVPLYYAITPYSFLGSGKTWRFGPHTIKQEKVLPLNLAGASLSITEGSKTGVIDLITGRINSTSVTTIDQISVNGFHALDYFIQITNNVGQISSQKLSMVVTGITSTGALLTPYAVSSNSNITYSLGSTSNSVLLRAQTSSAPVDYVIYKTSI
jgi:hypothetical protein